MSPYLNHAEMAYTIEEASSLLSLSRAQICRLIDLGEIETIKVGKARRVTSKQLDAFLNARELERVSAPPSLDSLLRQKSRRNLHERSR